MRPVYCAAVLNLNLPPPREATGLWGECAEPLVREPLADRNLIAPIDLTASGGDQFHGVPSQLAHQPAADHSAVPDNEGRPASGSTRIFGSYGAQTY